MTNTYSYGRPLGWLRSACWIFVSTMLLASCEKPALGPSEANIGGPSLTNPTGNVANLNNPFSLAVMQQAYDSLRARQASKSASGQGLAKGSGSGPMQKLLLVPTHQYVRFLAANTNQLAELDSVGFELSWEPLDETVAASTPVDFTSNSIPWVYTVVPYGTVLPSYIQTELIQDLYLFDEDDGDTQDEPYTPTPTPTCRPQWDPVTQRPLPCPQKQTPKRSILREATEQLERAGASPQELYNEAMRLSHHEDEMLPEGTPQARASSTRYYPSGTIRMEETALARSVPVRGVRVKSRRWFKYGSTYTNATGQFYISTGYRSKARIFVEFKNSLATTRGFINSFKFWEAVLPIKYGLGLFTRTGLQNINGLFSYQRDQHSVGARAWVAATLFNTLADAQNFSAARSIPGPPSGINVWLMPDAAKGSTPMLRYIASTSAVSQIIDYLLIGSGLGNIFLAKQILQRQLPDVTIDYFGDGPGTLDSYALNKLIYHELGHTQHYAQVGNNFWTAYIGYIVYNGGYGQKTSSGSGRIAISEAWGNYTESIFANDRYQADSPTLAARAIARLEDQYAGNGNSFEWIVYGMLYDMTDTTEPFYTGITDNVDAYNTASVFRGLQPNVTTVRGYEAQVLAQNNQLQAAQFDQLVTSYLW